MTNAYDPNYEDDTNDSDLMPYDDAVDDEDLVAELLAEGYSEDEALRMVGDYNADEFYGFEDDSDRDIPDFIDDGDFE
jgi:hypothetical protein